MAFRHIKEIYSTVSELQFGIRIMRVNVGNTFYEVATVDKGGNPTAFIDDTDGKVYSFPYSSGDKGVDYESTKHGPISLNEYGTVSSSYEPVPKYFLKERQFAICTNNFEVNEVDTGSGIVYELGNYIPKNRGDVVLLYRDDHGKYYSALTKESEITKEWVQNELLSYVKVSHSGNVSIKGALTLKDASSNDVVTITGTDGTMTFKDASKNDTVTITGSSGAIDAGTITGNNYKISKILNGSTIEVISNEGAFTGSGLTVKDLTTSEIKEEITADNTQIMLNENGKENTTKDITLSSSAGSIVLNQAKVPANGANKNTATLTSTSLKITNNTTEGASDTHFSTTINENKIHLKGNAAEILINNNKVLTDTGAVTKNYSYLNIGANAQKIFPRDDGEVHAKAMIVVNEIGDEVHRFDVNSTFTARSPEEAALFRKSETPEYPLWSIKGESDGTEHTLEFDYLYKKDQLKEDVTRVPITRFSKDRVLFQKPLNVTDSTNTENLSLKTNSIVLEDVADTEPGRTQWKLQANQKNDLYEQRKAVVDFIADAQIVAKKFSGLGLSDSIVTINDNDLDDDVSFSKTTKNYREDEWPIIVSTLLGFKNSQDDILIGEKLGGTELTNMYQPIYLKGAMFEAKYATGLGDVNTPITGSLYYAIQITRQALKILKAAATKISTSKSGDAQARLAELANDAESYYKNIPDLATITGYIDFSHNSFSLLQDEKGNGEFTREVAEFTVATNTVEGNEITTKQLDITGRDSYAHSTGKVLTNTLELEDDRDGKDEKTKWSLTSKQGTEFDIAKKEVISLAETVSDIAVYVNSNITTHSSELFEIEGSKSSLGDWGRALVKLAGYYDDISNTLPANFDNPKDNGNPKDNNMSGALLDAYHAQRVGTKLKDGESLSYPKTLEEVTLFTSFYEIENVLLITQLIVSQLKSLDKSIANTEGEDRWSNLENYLNSKLIPEVSTLKSKLASLNDANHADTANFLEVVQKDTRLAVFEKNESANSDGVSGTLRTDKVHATSEITTKGSLSFTNVAETPVSINSLFVKDGQLVFKDATGSMYEVKLGAKIEEPTL